MLGPASTQGHEEATWKQTYEASMCAQSVNIRQYLLITHCNQ